jgi:DNA-binding NtrC family response regulator
MIKKRILFIETEPARREWLEQGLIHRRNRWDLTFVGTSAEARKLMDQTPVDAIIADAEQLGTSVVEFFKEVQVRFPKTLRFIRLHHAEKGLIRSWTGSPPSFLPRECEVEKIEDAIEREFQLELWLANGADPRFAPASCECSVSFAIRACLEAQPTGVDPESPVVAVGCPEGILRG